jgi:hypothetical protein
MQHKSDKRTLNSVEMAVFAAVLALAALALGIILGLLGLPVSGSLPWL